MAKKERLLPRNPLVPKLNDHKNQTFKDKKKERDRTKCRKRIDLTNE